MSSVFKVLRRMRSRRSASGQAGFTLVEAMVALSVLAVGLLGMAGVLTNGLKRLATAPSDIIARQKAVEAIESVYTARDTRVLIWAQIRNVSGGTGADGGVFRDGALPLRDPGPDGLVNTADDGNVEAVVQPGPDGLLGTADDVRTALSNYTREIRIRDVSATLREIRVTVTLTTGVGRRDYVITTLISSFA
jgi:prepilin-type N-terminal cleavage/methylation domain-containing protein